MVASLTKQGMTGSALLFATSRQKRVSNVSNQTDDPNMCDARPVRTCMFILFLVNHYNIGNSYPLLSSI